VDTTEVAWLAGLFEGEGSIAIAKNGGTRLSIRMCDRDIIDRVNALFPATTIQVVVPKPAKGYSNQPQTQYAWRISNPETVREILTLILPWLGERRSQRAREVLEHLSTRPGGGGFNRLKTHCAAGHQYSTENTYIRPGTDHRHCRTCRTAWAATYRAKRSV
jgi:hypothetical protein